MKLSKYNNHVPYEGKIVLYNAFSDKFLLIEPFLKEMYDAIQYDNGLDDLKNSHPTFFNILEEKGFVIDNAVDELAQVKKLREDIDLLDEKEYRLIINPTMNCNFKCWYCYESHVKDSKMDDIMVENVKNHILNVVKMKPFLKRFRISWFGGEPLLFYDKVIKPLSIYAKDILTQHHIALSSNYTTNGFLIDERMIPDFHLFNTTSFQITLDGNRQMHNEVRYVSAKRGSYDEILDNIRLLCKGKLHVSLRINFTKSNLHNLDEIINDLKDLKPEYKKYITVTFHKVWQEKDTNLGEIVKSIHLKFRTAGFRSILGGLPDNVRNSCYADKKNQATINFNGEVFKCTARNFSSSTKEGDLDIDGSVVWNEKLDERLDIKFKNKPCLECSIMPICNGGCSQKALENIGRDYCVYDFDDTRKKEIVLNKFLHFTTPYTF